MPAPPESPQRPRILLFSEDEDIRSFCRDELSSDYELLVTRREDELLERLGAAEAIALVLLDHAAGERERAFSLRERIVRLDPRVPVAVMMDPGDEETAVAALRHGFADYIAKRQDTLEADLLRKRIAATIELATLKRENEALQQAIEESQKRLFNIYDSLDDVIMQVDEDCRIVSLNRSAAALASCEPREAVGRICHEVFDFFPCERRARKEACHIYRTFLEGETIRGEREEPKSGSSFTYMTFITTLNDQDYTVYRETNITEKRRLEERIANALESLGVSPPRRAPEDG